MHPEVIVIGGGFGGINVVKGLKDAPVNITLVDKHNYHLFQPLLYQVATAELAPEDIAAPLRQVVKRQKNVTVAMIELLGVDLERKTVRGRMGEKRYDYLVLATGVRPAYYGHDEYKQFAPGLKDLNDAVEIRRRILMAFEEAEFEEDELSRQGKLTFVIVGGGPTGVELSGAIIETATRTLPKEFRHIDTRTARVILVQGGDRLLPGMPAAMGERALRDLEAMGVEIRLNSRVTEVDGQGVKIGDERAPAENVIWAAGVHGQPLVETLGVELDRIGRVRVGPDLSLPDHPDVFVIGDAAQAIDANTGQPTPGVAQGAIQMGQLAAKIIQAEVEEDRSFGRPAFQYKDKGSMATIGRGKAVTSIGSRTLGGFLGWLAWGAVHMFFLVSFRSRFSVIMEWFWNYVSGERRSRLIHGNPVMHVKVVRGVKLFGGKDEG